jgi:hypothetical protein
MRIRIYNTEERKVPEMSQNAGAASDRIRSGKQMFLFKMHQENEKEKKIPRVPVL